MDTPFVKPFNVGSSCYIYDVNTNRISRLTEPHLRTLCQWLVSGTLNSPSASFLEWLSRMRKAGFLSAREEQAVEHPLSSVYPLLVAAKVRHVCLQVTQRCNLRCKYCVYSGSYYHRTHSSKEMPLDTAKRGVDFLREHSREVGKPHISFYGGEPLMRVDTIRAVVRYAKRVFRGRDITFGLTTNGTLCNQEIVDVLTKNDFAVTISLDGPREVHDRNRCFPDGRGSYNRVVRLLNKLRQTSESFVKRKVSYNIVLDSSSNFCDILAHYSSNEILHWSGLVLYGPVDTSLLREGTRCAASQQDRRLAEERCKAHLLAMLAITGRAEPSLANKLVVSAIRRDVLRLRAHLDERRVTRAFHPGGPCVPGIQRVFVDIDGRLFPCERVSEECEECSIGDIEKGIDIDRARSMLNLAKATPTACGHCWARHLCTACIKSCIHGKVIDHRWKLEACGQIRADAEERLRRFAVYREAGVM